MKTFGNLHVSFVVTFVILSIGLWVPAGAFAPRLGVSSSAAVRQQSLIVRPLVPKLQHRTCLHMTDASDDDEAAEEKTDVVSESTSSADDKIKAEELSRLQRLRKRLFPPKADDGLTFRQRLAKAGLSVLLSYGWVSNVSYCVTVSLAWYISSKRSGLSPLAPGQWKPFLAVYAGFYVFNNIIRPLRFALSVSVSMYFDRVVQSIQDKFKVKRGVAIGLTVFLANIVGTISLMCLGISIAAAAAGVPVFAGK